jgi:Holliday junction resolvase-like predicted endonuclease
MAERKAKNNYLQNTIQNYLQKNPQNNKMFFDIDLAVITKW